MKILVAGWDSGGGVEAVQTIVRRAVARGHDVRVLGTEGLRDRFESAGAVFRRYQYAPDNDLRRPETDLVKDWQARNPLSLWVRVRDRLLIGPAREFCRDVLEELRRNAADVVVVDTMIPTALLGAEVAGVPAVVVMHGAYMVPRAEVPPLGTGFMPASGRLGRLRDRSAAAVASPPSATGCPPSTGSAPRSGSRRCGMRSTSWATPTGYWSAAARATTSRPARSRPMSAMSGRSSTTQPTRRPAARGPFPPAARSSSWACSTVMRQERLLQRAADALGQLPVRGLVTTGPAVDPAVIAAPPNVTVARWARHADVLPHCSAVITHGGHGTVMKALIAGIPLVVVPLGRDQPDNAARVVYAGAGVRLRKNASARVLRDAVARVIEDPRYRDGAARMASRLAAERDANLAIQELECVATAGLRLTRPAGAPRPGQSAAGRPAGRTPG
jgi:UDP:flavonoid glycosyltransferase YjiC (YdhE family)